MKVNYIETVWNGYEVRGVDEDYFAPLSFQEGLQENYNGNVWFMKSDLESKGIVMNIELEEACYIFVDTAYELVEVT